MQFATAAMALLLQTKLAWVVSVIILPLGLSCRTARLWSGVPFKGEGIDMVSSKDLGQTAEYQNNVVDLNKARQRSLQKPRQQVMRPSNQKAHDMRHTAALSAEGCLDRMPAP